MLAAERATEEDRDMLKSIIRELEEAHAQGKSEASRDADVRFHAAIVDASHNSLMVHTMSAIYQLMARNVFYNREFLRTMDGTGAELLKQHKEIAQAIIDGDPDRAEAAARRHMDFVEESFRTGQEQQAREIRAAKRRQLTK